MSDDDLLDTTRIPIYLPPVEEARFIKALVMEGWDALEIVKDAAREFITPDMSEAQRTRKRASFRSVVRRIVEEPRLWDPDMDEIAIEKAYDGDPEAWLGLSYYERRECMNRLVETYETKPFHRHWPDRPVTEGMTAWAYSVGAKVDRVSNLAKKRRDR